jgi:peroxiredoxin
MNRTGTLLALVGALAAGPALANVKSGDPAPPIEGEFLGASARSTADLGARVLLVQFFRTDSAPCSAEVARLNELAERHGGAGLTVVGVASEPKKVVEAALAREPRAFPVVVATGDKAEKLYGVPSVPHTLVVDVEGRIAWTGALAELDPKELEGWLADVVPDVDARWQDARKALAARSYDKAVEAIDRALAAAPGDAGLEACKARILALCARRVARADQDRAEQRFGEAAARYARIVRDFGVLPCAAAAEGARAAIEKDPAAKDDLAAWKLHEKAEQRAVAGDDEAAVAEWKKLVAKHPAAKTAERAKRALRQRGR